MSWTANIQGSYGASSMTVSWTAPASLPNTYTVSAQPGGLTATVAGSATSATLTTTLMGVAYTVSVVANYSGSTQTATAILVSPPTALQVPLTTDVAPWAWYDSADPTTVRCNSNGVLTEWYNKGTSAGSTNGNVSVSGSVTYGSVAINGRAVVNIPSGTEITTPSIALTGQPIAIFGVVRLPATISGSRAHAIFSPNGNAAPYPAFGIGFNGTYNITKWSTGGTGAVVYSTSTSYQTNARMFAVVNSATLANNIATQDGIVQTLTSSIATSGYSSAAMSYKLGWAADSGNSNINYAEVLVYNSEINTTQRLQIEGYLAWKWGLQTQLPATHPFSTTNMATSMAAYNTPRMYVSNFASLSSYSGGLLRGLGIDSSGNMYVGASTAIVRITPAGVVSNFTTAGGTQNRTGIAVGPNGDVYVHERNAPVGTGTVRRFTNSGSVVYTATIPEFGFGISVDNSGNAYSHVGGTNAMYRISPTGTVSTRAFGDRWGTVTFDSSNNAYLLNHPDCSIYRISADGSTTTYIAGSGNAATVDGIREGASFRADFTPGMWFDSSSGILYIAGNNNVRMVTQSGVVRTIAGPISGITGSTNGLDATARFNGTVGVSLEGIVRDRQGNFYIIDSGNAVVRRMSLGALNQVGSFVSSGFNNAAALTTDRFGNIYIGNYEGGTISRITPTGDVSTFINSSPNPSGFSIDELGNMFVSETARIRKITPAGLVVPFVGTGSTGSSDDLGTSAAVNNPHGIVLGPDGNFYFSDANANRVKKITRSGFVSTIAGTGVAGSDDASGNPLNATLNNPTGIAFDNAGNMYIADRGGNRIRKINTAGVISTFAGSGSAATSDGVGISASLFRPQHIVIDRSDVMYVTEHGPYSAATGGKVVRRITMDGAVTTIAGSTTGGQVFTDAVGTAARFYLPNVIALDSADNLWITDAAGTSSRLRHIAINAPPAGSVSITGTLTQGQTITANTSALVDSDILGAFSYTWSSSPTVNGVYTTIAGATGASLTLSEAHVGRFIRVVVSYTDGRGSAEAVSATPVGTVANVNDPATGLAISGTLRSGLTVSANLASLADPDGIVLPYTYQWASSASALSGFIDISGATSSSYTLTSAEVGRFIRLTVGYSNSYGAADSAVVVSGTTVLAGNTPASGSLDISGSLTEGTTVRAIAALVDPDGIGALRYTWSTATTANGVFTVDASGTDLSGITLSFGQTERFLRVQVSYTDGLGNAENMISSVVGPIAAYPAPNAPTIGVATAGVTSVSLSWSAPVSNSPIAITGYEIYNENNVLVKSIDANTLSTVITDLPPGIAKQFRVVAINARGLVGNSSPLSQAATPTAPSVAAVISGQVSEVIDVPVSVAGVETLVKKLTAVDVPGSGRVVSYDPVPGVKAAVAVAGLPVEVEKVVIATAAPRERRYGGSTLLKIVAFDGSGESVSSFAAAPITITANIPGYTAATLTITTFDEFGGPVRDTTTATRNVDGSYSFTLSHLTYLRVTENVPCFVAGTKILTAVGYKAVEDIVDGELVATADGRALPCRMYITEIVRTTRENAPYVIPANTFGPRCPAQDLTISPLHAIQMSRGVWQIPKMAASLYNGIRQMPTGESCIYYHLEMPNYLTDNIVAEGTVVESYGARQLAGRRVEYKFNGAAGGFIRTIHEGRRAVASRR